VQLYCKWQSCPSAMKAYGEVELYLHAFLAFTLVGGVVSFTPWPLYPRGNSPRYSLDMRLGGPQRRSFPARTGKRSQVVQPVVWLLY
jgi:hypothetical protein